MFDAATSVCSTPTDLRRVDEQQHVALAARCAQRLDVGAETRGERHRRDRRDARARIHALDELVDRDVAVARRHHAHFDAVALQVEPRVDVVRVLELRAEHDVVAAAASERPWRSC